MKLPFNVSFKLSFLSRWKAILWLFIDSKNMLKSYCLKHLLPIFMRYLIENHCVKSVRIQSYSGPYSVRLQDNTDQNNSKYGHFSRSEYYWKYIFRTLSLWFSFRWFLHCTTLKCNNTWNTFDEIPHLGSSHFRHLWGVW